MRRNKNPDPVLSERARQLWKISAYRKHHAVTDETRKKLSVANRKRWSDPKSHKEASRSQCIRWQNPEQRELASLASSKAIRIKWQDPQYRKKQSVAQSKRATDCWEDSKFRSKLRKIQSANAVRQWRRFSFRSSISKKLAKAARKKWKDPLFRQKGIAANRNKWKDPGYRKKISKSMSKMTRRLWKDCKYREKMSLIRSAQGVGNKESKQSNLVKNKLGLPKKEFAKFGYSWDGAWPQRKILFEFQGCYWHECRRCGYGDSRGAIARTVDLRKKRMAAKNGWKVLYAWGHDIKAISSDSKKWLKSAMNKLGKETAK